jgi:hypothetical protein
MSVYSYNKSVDAFKLSNEITTGLGISPLFIEVSVTTVTIYFDIVLNAVQETNLANIVDSHNFQIESESTINSGSTLNSIPIWDGDSWSELSTFRVNSNSITFSTPAIPFLITNTSNVDGIRIIDESTGNIVIGKNTTGNINIINDFGSINITSGTYNLTLSNSGSVFSNQIRIGGLNSLATPTAGMLRYDSNNLQFYNTAWRTVATTADLPSLILPTGSTTNSTLRWNGTAWVENAYLRSNGTSVSVNTTTTTAALNISGNLLFTGSNAIQKTNTGNLTLEHTFNGAGDLIIRRVAGSLNTTLTLSSTLVNLNNKLRILSPSASITPLEVRAAAAHSTDILIVQNNIGETFSKFRNDGSLVLNDRQDNTGNEAFWVKGFNQTRLFRVIPADGRVDMWTEENTNTRNMEFVISGSYQSELSWRWDGETDPFIGLRGTGNASQDTFDIYSYNRGQSFIQFYAGYPVPTTDYRIRMFAPTFFEFNQLIIDNGANDFEIVDNTPNTFKIQKSSSTGNIEHRIVSSTNTSGNIILGNESTDALSQFSMFDDSLVFTTVNKTNTSSNSIIIDENITEFTKGILIGDVDNTFANNGIIKHTSNGFQFRDGSQWLSLRNSTINPNNTASLFKQTTIDTLNSGTPVSVAFDGINYLGSNFNQPSSTELRVLSSGLYELSYTVTFVRTGGNSNISAYSELQLNNSTISGSVAQTYVSNNNAYTFTLSSIVILNINANQIISVILGRLSGNLNANTVVNACTLNAKRLN